MRFRRDQIAVLAFTLLTVVACDSAPIVMAADELSSPLILETEIPLDRVAGRIDHMAVDLERHRLLVAELGNDTVDVIDLDTLRPVNRITGLHEPQGVGVSAGLLVVANGGDGTVALYRNDDLSPLGSIALGEDADDVHVDQRTGRIFVGFGEGAVAIVDPATRAKIGEIKVAAHPEGFQFAAGGDQGYINVPGAHQIAVISDGRQVASWSLPRSQANFPLALDAAGATAAVVFRNPPRLALYDTKTGAARVKETCGDADDVFFDDRRSRVYVSCGSGAVDVFNKAQLSRLAEITTKQGARTSLFVPELDRLFVAARSGWFSDAKILVYRPEDGASRK